MEDVSVTAHIITLAARVRKAIHMDYSSQINGSMWIIMSMSTMHSRIAQATSFSREFLMTWQQEHLMVVFMFTRTLREQRHTRKTIISFLQMMQKWIPNPSLRYMPMM